MPNTDRPKPCACRATRNELPAIGFDHGPLSCGATNPPGRRTWRDLAPMRLRRHLAHRRLAADFAIAMALRDGHAQCAYPLSRAAGVRSGRLYPALTRLEQQGLVASGWTQQTPVGLPRRWYRLTETGQRSAWPQILNGGAPE